MCRSSTALSIALTFFVAALTGAASCRSARSDVDSAHAHGSKTQTRRASGDSIRVPIFVYHSIAHHHEGQTGEQRELDVDTATFRAQMDEIARDGRAVISLGALVDALRGKGSVPTGAVVLTFDDGWLDQYEDALPILERHHFTATFFVYTTAIGNGPAFMTWDQLREMQHAGMTIGAHSRTHPDLTSANVSLADEINGSRADIARKLGVTPDLFAYPYGARDARVANAVRAAGYRAARALADGPLNTRATLFELRAIRATDDMSEFEQALREAR